MVRFETDEGVAYGTDPASGIFLSVEKGEDEYFDLHTGTFGMGKRVTQQTMAVYWEWFGLPKSHIVKFLGQACVDKLALMSATQKSEIIANGTGANTLMKEAEGQSAALEFLVAKMSVSNEEGPKTESEAHKQSCSTPVPKKGTPSKVKGGQPAGSVYGMLFPDLADNPQFVKVALEQWGDGNYHCVVPKIEPFLNSECIGKSHMRQNLLKGNRALKDTLMFFFRDNYLNDGSAPNGRVKKAVDEGDRVPHPCAGPVLVVKYKGEFGPGNENPVDVQLSDAADIIDFFKTYPNAHSDSTPEWLTSGQFGDFTVLQL